MQIIFVKKMFCHLHMSKKCSNFAPVFNFCTMQKHIYLLSLSVAVLCLLSANVFAKSVTPAANIPAYWSSVDGKSGAELWKAISAQTNVGFSSIGYKGLYSAYLKTDLYPADSASRAGKIWDMYGECNFAPTKTCGSYKSVCDCYNREHSIPQSWFGGGTSGIGCDIFHVLPTDGKVNGVRSNYEYGEVNGGTNWVGNKFGSAGSWSTDRKTIASAAGESVSGTGQVFEPKPQYKGDIARGIMGTIIKWQHSSLTSGNNFFNSTYTVSGNFGLTKKAVVLLMKWHREDPVSRKEIDRNNGIQETQGNRNPFIDYPYLAEYIWGEHAGEAVDMDFLMPSTDPDFVPGVSDGARTFVPPIPAAMYGVTWSVNGEITQTDSVQENKNVTALPTTPVSCSTESDVFMGWTDEPIETTQDEAPTVLYKAVADFPAVSADVTYYAVFARAAEMEPSLPATYTYSANDPIADWSNTATNKGSYWLLDSGKELISPEVDLSGLSSIQAKLRTFGGTQYDQFSFAAGNTRIGTITVSEGSTMTEYEWTNTKSLSGKSRITFTCSNAGSGKGVGFSYVTINGTGVADIYIRFITSCQDPQEIDLTPAEGPARKHLINGHILIQTSEGLFTITGQKVK